MPKWSDGLKRWTKRSAATLKASAAETASTTGASLELDGGSLHLKVDVTVVAGTTPTMLLVVETSDDGVTWYTAGRIGANGYVPGDSGTDPTNFTAPLTKRAILAVASFVRYRSVIGGTTPSFTYSITYEIDG